MRLLPILYGSVTHRQDSNLHDCAFVAYRHGRHRDQCRLTPNSGSTYVIRAILQGDSLSIPGRSGTLRGVNKANQAAVSINSAPQRTYATYTGQPCGNGGGVTSGSGAGSTLLAQAIDAPTGNHHANPTGTVVINATGRADANYNQSHQSNSRHGSAERPSRSRSPGEGLTTPRRATGGIGKYHTGFVASSDTIGQRIRRSISAKKGPSYMVTSGLTVTPPISKRVVP